MKLKYHFSICEVAGDTVAIAVGDDAVRFNGMIRLNQTARCLFEALREDTNEEKLVDCLTADFAVGRQEALASTVAFVGQLRENGLLEE